MTSQLSGASRLFPIIGDPIRYVESPVWLTSTFADRGRNGICVPMRVPDGDLDVVMAGLTAIANVDGILVTMPHKHAAFAYCATSSDRAALLGAVSVIRPNTSGTWHGDMLDGLAFVKAQQDHGARIDQECDQTLMMLAEMQRTQWRWRIRSLACTALIIDRADNNDCSHKRCKKYLECRA
jgi:shikimate dehydrogenase